MKILIRKLITKIILIIIISVFVNIGMSAFAPVINNNIMLGQLENSDMIFILMESYNKLVNYITNGYYIAIAIIVCYMGYDIYSYIKNYIKSKENI